MKVIATRPGDSILPVTPEESLARGPAAPSRMPHGTTPPGPDPPTAPRKACRNSTRRLLEPGMVNDWLGLYFQADDLLTRGIPGHRRAHRGRRRGQRRRHGHAYLRGHPAHDCGCRVDRELPVPAESCAMALEVTPRSGPFRDEAGASHAWAQRFGRAHRWGLGHARYLGTSRARLHPAEAAHEKPRLACLVVTVAVTC